MTTAKKIKEEIMPTDEEPIKIICGDCLEIMNQIPNNSIDMVFLDPPFGINFKENTTRVYSQGMYKKQVSKETYYDDFSDSKEYSEWSKKWLKNIFRVLSKTGVFVLVSGWTNVSYLDINSRDLGFKLLNHCIWKYEFGVYCNKKFVTSHYSILIFVKDLNNYRTNIPEYKEDVILDIRRTDKKSYEHPCTMNEKLPRRFIQYFSNKDDLVLDCFLGSGTTAVACKQLGRKCIGIEINPEYCKIAKQRLQQEVLNL